MIYGIGTDIVEIKRIQDATERWGSKFLSKLFTDNEITYCYSRKNCFSHFAARFAAKEAVIKAASSKHKAQSTKYGLKILKFQDIEVLNQPTGRPFINLRGKLRESFSKLSVITHLTMSHEQSYATATVVIEER